jgi:hypothetical protein
MEVVSTLGTGQTKVVTQYLLKTFRVLVRLIYGVVAACINPISITDPIALEREYVLYALL